MVLSVLAVAPQVRPVPGVVLQERTVVVEAVAEAGERLLVPEVPVVRALNGILHTAPVAEEEVAATNLIQIQALQLPARAAFMVVAVPVPRAT